MLTSQEPNIIGTLKILFVKLVVLLLDFIMAYGAQIPQKWCEVLSKDPQLFVRKLRPCIQGNPIIKLLKEINHALHKLRL